MEEANMNGLVNLRALMIFLRVLQRRAVTYRGGKASGVHHLSNSMLPQRIFDQAF